MKAKYGSIIVSGSGSLGGHVFSASSKGFSCRNSGCNANPSSSRQRFCRTSYASACARWRGLTLSQRNTWINQFYAGLSGFQLFLSINLTRYLFRQSFIAFYVQPPVFPSYFVTGCAMSLAAKQLFFTFSSSAVNTYQLLLSATNCMSAGRKAFDKDYRQIAAIGSQPFQLVNFWQFWESVFGSKSSLTGAVSFKFVLVYNGFQSQVVYFTKYF